MHRYLKSIGFTYISNREQLDDLLNEVINAPTDEVYIKKSNGDILMERSKEFGPFIGIAVRGTINKDGEFVMEYYFPYFCGAKLSTEEKIDIERYAEKDAYAAICDDTRIGVPLIFFMQNPIEYFKNTYQKGASIPTESYLSALSTEGIVILPVEPDKPSKNKNGMSKKDRASLISAARDGDEESIESLTLEEIDIYSMISRRIQHEDVYSIVDTYFMPYGVETDNYSIMGTIMDFRYIKNRETLEECCVMELDCNGLIFEVCINTFNLMGEPAIGRRFKGTIWMQGVVMQQV